MIDVYRNLDLSSKEYIHPCPKKNIPDDTLQCRHNERDGVSQNTKVSSDCSAFCLGANQRKHQNSASLAFVRGGFPSRRVSDAENVSIW